MKNYLRCQKKNQRLFTSSGIAAIALLLIINISGLTARALGSSFSREHSTTGSRPIFLVSGNAKQNELMVETGSRLAE